MSYKHAFGHKMEHPAAKVVNHEVLAESKLFEGIAKILTKDITARHHEDKQAILKGIKVLRGRGFDCTANLEKAHHDFLTGIWWCIRQAMQYAATCLEDLFTVVAKIIETLAHPRKAAQDELDAARRFCAELGRELFNEAYGI